MLLFLGKNVQNALKKRLQYHYQHKNFHHLKPHQKQLLNKPQYVMIPVRRFILRLFIKPTTRDMKIKDKIPETHNLIYRSNIHRYLVGAQIFTTLSAAIAMLAFLYQENLDEISIHTEFKPRSVANEELIYLGSLMLLCVCAQSFVHRIPLRIYNLPQTKQYTFVFCGTLPTTKKKLYCNLKDVVKLEEKGIMPWKDSKKPVDLNIMLGYQEQPDDYD